MMLRKNDANCDPNFKFCILFGVFHFENFQPLCCWLRKTGTTVTTGMNFCLVCGIFFELLRFHKHTCHQRFPPYAVFFDVCHSDSFIPLGSCLSEIGKIRDQKLDYCQVLGIVFWILALSQTYLSSEVPPNLTLWGVFHFESFRLICFCLCENESNRD